MEVDTGLVRPDRLRGTNHMEAAWRPDSSALFYVATDDGKESIYEHRIGSDAPAEQLFGGHEDYWCAVTVSECGRYAVLYQWDFVHANNVFLLRLADDELVPVATTMQAVNQVQVVDDELLIVTDLDAPRGRLCKASVRSPTEWHTVIAESNDTLQTVVGSVAGCTPSTSTRGRTGSQCMTRTAQDPRRGASGARVGERERGGRGCQRCHRELARRRGVGRVPVVRPALVDLPLRLRRRRGQCVPRARCGDRRRDRTGLVRVDGRHEGLDVRRAAHGDRRTSADCG